jgi:hypothetical protein
MATKHIPIRTCIATGDKKPKNELMRFVLISGGGVIVDPHDRARGRGANLTMTNEAFDLAIKKRAFERALKLKNPFTQEEIVKLKEKFIDAIQEKQFRKGNQAVTIKLSKEEYSKALSSNG